MNEQIYAETLNPISPSVDNLWQLSDYIYYMRLAT